MTQNALVIFIALVMGAMVNLAARVWVPWPEKYNPFFWVAGFLPMITMELLHVQHPAVQLFVFPFCTGLIVSEVLRQKLTAWWMKMVRLAQGQPVKSKVKTTKPPKKK